MLNVLSFLWEKISAIFPFVMVLSFQRGVLFHFGKDVATLEPGLHFKWWFIDEIVVIAVKREVIELNVQSLTTKDGQPIAFRIGVELEIVDARAYHVEVQDTLHTIEVASMMHISRKVRDWTLAELREHQGDLEKSLERTLATRVKPYGVAVYDVGVIEFAAARHYRVWGDKPLY